MMVIEMKNKDTVSDLSSDIYQKLVNEWQHSITPVWL